MVRKLSELLYLYLVNLVKLFLITIILSSCVTLDINNDVEVVPCSLISECTGKSSITIGDNLEKSTDISTDLEGEKTYVVKSSSVMEVYS